jgi:hypothetical protein
MMVPYLKNTSEVIYEYFHNFKRRSKTNMSQSYELFSTSEKKDYDVQLGLALFD